MSSCRFLHGYSCKIFLYSHPRRSYTVWVTPTLKPFGPTPIFSDFIFLIIYSSRRNAGLAYYHIFCPMVLSKEHVRCRKLPFDKASFFCHLEEVSARLSESRPSQGLRKYIICGIKYLFSFLVNSCSSGLAFRLFGIILVFKPVCIIQYIVLHFIFHLKHPHPYTE